MATEKIEDLQTKLQLKIKKCKEEIEKRTKICINLIKDQENEDWKLECLTYKFQHMHPNHPEYKDIEKEKINLEKSRENYEKTVRQIHFERYEIEKEKKYYQSELSQIININ